MYIASPTPYTWKSSNFSGMRGKCGQIDHQVKTQDIVTTKHLMEGVMSQFCGDLGIQ